MNDESNSKRTFKTMWTCQFQVPLIYLHGAQKETMNLSLANLQEFLVNTLQDSGGSHATLTVHVEVNPSQSVTTKPQSTTKEPSLKNTMSATSPDTVVPAEYKGKTFKEIKDEIAALIYSREFSSEFLHCGRDCQCSCHWHNVYRCGPCRRNIDT
jgi:uncharacterized alpha/beta hydrolase family protein